MVIVLLALLLQGCVTVAMKTVDGANGMGHPFAGMRAYAAGIKCVLVYPIAIPFLIIDFPFSLAADILFLPVDLYVDPKGPLNAGSTCV